MLEITQDLIRKISGLLDSGDTESAGKLLVGVDQTSLRAALIHILRERGSEVADAVGAAYLRENEAQLHNSEAA